MFAYERNAKSVVLLSVAVGEGARNLHNVVLDVADRSNAQWGSN